MKVELRKHLKDSEMIEIWNRDEDCLMAVVPRDSISSQLLLDVMSESVADSVMCTLSLDDDAYLTFEESQETRKLFEDFLSRQAWELGELRAKARKEEEL